LRAGPGTLTLVDLTRGGWSNTAGMQRSTLERVSYRLTGETLQRSYQTVLDPTTTNQPVMQDLLSGVTSIQFNFLDTNQNWNTLWPPATLPLPDRNWTRPVAVEIIIEFKDWGHIRRLVEIAG
jgi:general secretion pathway protein J